MHGESESAARLPADLAGLGNHMHGGGNDTPHDDLQEYNACGSFQAPSRQEPAPRPQAGRGLLMRRRPSVDTVRVFSAADGVQTYEYSGGGCPRGRRRASAVPRLSTVSRTQFMSARPRSTSREKPRSDNVRPK